MAPRARQIAASSSVTRLDGNLAASMNIHIKTAVRGLMAVAAFACVLSCVFSSRVARGELIRNYMEGTRPTGMGGAFIGIADDHNAIWYNPAGLGFMKGTSLNMLDLTLGVDSVDTLNRFTNGVLTNNFNNILRPDRQFNRMAVRPTFLTRYFGFSIYQSLNSFVEMSNLETLDMQVDMFAYNDVGAIAAIGYPILPHLSLGASMRIFMRTGVDATITAESLLEELAVSGSADVTSAAYNQLARLMGTGWAIGATVGALAKIPFPKDYPEAKLGVTVEDFTDTEFRELATDRRPPNMRRTINMGASLKNNLPGGSALTFAFDVRRNFEGLPFFKQLYAGAEYRTKYFSLRGGLYQAKPAFGISIETPPHTRIHFSTYAPSLDKNIWGKAQRWYVLQLIIGFNPL